EEAGHRLTPYLQCLPTCGQRVSNSDVFIPVKAAPVSTSLEDYRRLVFSCAELSDLFEQLRLGPSPQGEWPQPRQSRYWICHTRGIAPDTADDCARPKPLLLRDERSPHHKYPKSVSSLGPGATGQPVPSKQRSEERRVGKECRT